MDTSLFEAILHTNVINFAIVITTLVFVFKKCKLGDIIENMASEIKNRVEKSSYDTQAALSEYKNVKKAVKDTPRLQEEIIRKAQGTAQNIKDEIENDISAKKEELYEGYEKSNRSLIEKYKKMTADEIYTACINIAQDEVIKRLDKEAHERLINSSIDELDKIEGGLV